MFCKFCGKENPDDNKFCSGCGKDLTQTNAPDAKFCQFCGTENSEENKFCRKCGKQIKDDPTPEKEEIPVAETEIKSELPPVEKNEESASSQNKPQKDNKEKPLKTKKGMPLIFKFILTLIVIIGGLGIFYFTVGSSMVADYMISGGENKPEFVQEVSKEIPKATEHILQAIGRYKVTPEEFKDMVEDMTYSDLVEISDKLNQNGFNNKKETFKILVSILDEEKYNTEGMRLGLMKIVPHKDLQKVFEEVDKMKGPQLYAAFPVFKKMILKSIEENQAKK